MKKILQNSILYLFALLEISPLIFLFAGTFMGNQEVISYIAPVLKKGDGYASWRLFPVFPTLKNIAGLLLDSP